MASMSSSIQFQRLAGSLPSIIQNNKNRIIVGIVVGVFVTCWKNYRDWRSAGPAGVPPNVKGWVLQWLVRLYASSDTKSTGCYTDPKYVQVYGGLGMKCLIVGDLPVRSGDRPVLLPWTIPHRQAPGTESSQVVRKLQRQEFEQIASDNPDLVVIKKSQLEMNGPALWLAPSIITQPWDNWAPGEIGHVHFEAEGSSHVKLSLLDAKEVIEKGWGERHSLSGKKVGARTFTPGYLLIYAPRNEEEVKVMGRILRAGAAYTSGEMKVH